MTISRKMEFVEEFKALKEAYEGISYKQPHKKKLICQISVSLFQEVLFNIHFKIDI